MVFPISASRGSLPIRGKIQGKEKYPQALKRKNVTVW